MVYGIISIVYGHTACGILKRMNRGRADVSQGFTVFETLIVLAVTTFLFMSAAIVINGRQQRTDFQVGSRDIQQQLRDIINQTVTGYYPSGSNFSCSQSTPNLRIVAGATEQGQNGDCVFAGTVLVFNPSAANLERYAVYPLAARRATVSGEIRDVVSPKEAAITAVARTLNPPNNTAPTVSSKRLPGNLQYVGGRIAGAPSFNTSSRFAFAVLSSFSNFVSVTNVSSGSQVFELRTFTGSWSGATPDAEAINAEASLANPYGIRPVTSGIELCFRGSSVKQSVLLRVSNGLAVTNQIYNGVTCT